MNGPISKEQFIESLKLPDSIRPKHFEGMNRYHFKYYGDGFVVLDLQNKYYHLRAREDYLRAVGVYDYTHDKNHPSKPGTIKCIPYNDTDVFDRLVYFITHDKTYTADDINTPRKPKEIIQTDNGVVQYVCVRCENRFQKAKRCPECGQLIKE